MEIGAFDFIKQQDLPTSALYMVATPIGNLGDITMRALHVLNTVDGIACEDTRHSAALLQQFGIHKKCIALHEHNEMSGAQILIQHLGQGERWAYISDAGTPGVSDPGARLVQEVQKAGFRTIPIPGASAVSSAISIGGSTLIHSAGRFQFLGFWPNKMKERESLLQEILNSKKTSIFFESPHHIKETLTTLSSALEPEREIVIGRELTKKFEQIVPLKVGEIEQWLENAQSLKGEFIILIGSRTADGDETPDHESLLPWVNALSSYLGSKEIAEILAKVLGLSKKQAYQIALNVKASKNLQ